MNKWMALPRTWAKGNRYALGAAGMGLAALVIMTLLLFPQESLLSHKDSPNPRPQVGAVNRDQSAPVKQSRDSTTPVASASGGVLPLARAQDTERNKGALEGSAKAAQAHDDSKPVKTSVEAKPEVPTSDPVITPPDSDQPLLKGQAAGGGAQSTVKKKASVKSAELSKKQELQVPETPAQLPRSRASTPKTGNLVIQIAAFGQELPAKNLMEKLEKMGYAPYLQAQTLENLGLVYRVRISGYAGLSEARAVKAQLKEQGFQDVFIVQPDRR